MFYYFKSNCLNEYMNITHFHDFSKTFVIINFFFKGLFQAIFLIPGFPRPYETQHVLVQSMWTGSVSGDSQNDSRVHVATEATVWGETGTRSGIPLS